MKNNKNVFCNDSPYKTNKLSKTLLVTFLTLLPLIIIWIICCQFNVLGLNWVVAQNGRYFIGNSQLKEINVYLKNNDWYLTGNFFKWHVNNSTDVIKIDQYQATLKVIPNFGEGYIFSKWMYLLIFGTLGINLIVLIPLTLFSKKIYLDIFPMVLSTWFGMTTLILTGLIPEKQPYTIPVQILAIIFVFVISLILFNFLFNKLMANSKWAETYYQKLLKEEKESEEYYEEYLKTKNKLNKKNQDTKVQISDEQK